MTTETRFLPPAGLNSLSIVHLSGHSLCIHRINPADGEPGTDCPVKFRKQAFELGCNPVGIQVDEEEDESDDKSALILKAVEAIIERNSNDELEADNRPTLKAMKAQAGFGVTRAELNAAWKAFEESLA
jgi:hypothetical protein